MRTDVSINGSTSPAARYISWAPSTCQIRLSDPAGAPGPVNVRLRNQRTNVGGQVVFYSARAGVGTPELDLTLPIDGASVSFWIGGKFGNPSIEDRDAAIEVIETASEAVLSMTQLMVRVRKDANTLTTAERDRFISALATLNDQGLGRFSEFRDMHTGGPADDEAHRFAGFLPWHRAYILDLEREFQNIEPGVSLPYWRFDRPAPALFSREFLGEADATGKVQFSPDHPLHFWRTDGALGIVRLPSFDSLNGNPSVRTEFQTLNIGVRFASFTTMEGNPHGRTHVSFDGYINSTATAPRDPLFFLLHANVDRLWAKWQWRNSRFDFATASFPFLGSAGTPGATRVGHNLNDTMWPWNGVIGAPRPPTAPGGTFGTSQSTSFPGLRPFVREMIDYQGVVNSASRLGFDYDDVPFEFS